MCKLAFLDFDVMKYLSSLRSLVWSLLASLSLLACGGGSSNPSNAVLSDAQGRWRGTLSDGGGSLNASTLVLPDGQTWMVYALSGGGLRLVQGTLSVDGVHLTGAAKLYDLDTGQVAGDLNWSASATAGSQLTLNSSIESLVVGNFTSTSFTSLNSPALVVAGVWKDSLSTPNTRWSIAGDGTLSGEGIGCTVSGSVLPRSDSAAVADVRFTETCTNSVTEWVGVGLQQTTLDSSEKLRFTLIKSDETQAFVLELIKAP